MTMPPRPFLHSLGRRLAIALLVVAAAVGAVRIAVWRAARGRMFDVASAPERPVAIVFGAAVNSAVLKDRVATGAALFAAHKVKHLLLTGDNRRPSYDEPRAMRKIALDLGVPEGALVLDYAGRRTYDSCARARAIFRLDGAILVTQDFHLPRALYLCENLGLTDVVGVAADRQAYRGAHWLWGRELLASVKAFTDVHVRRPYVVGGPALPIVDRPAIEPPPVPAGTDGDETDGE